MSTFRLHSVLSGRQMSADDPASHLAGINADLCGNFRPGEFATMLCGSIDSASSKVIYASAGAPPPILMSRKSWDSPEYCPSAGMPIGLRADSEYQNHMFDFDLGSFLLLYSDALLETPVNNSGALAEEGLIALVADLAKEKRDASIFEEIFLEFRKQADGPLLDDLTAFCISRPGI